jgi:hypothetical protein
MFKLKINVNKVTNGRDLPRVADDGLLFYEMVVTQHDFAHPILRVAFHPTKGPSVIDLELWRHDVVIPAENITKHSMSGTIARYDTLPLEIHFYKVLEDVDENEGPKLEGIVYRRHIHEGTSATQDVASFVITGERRAAPKYLDEFVFIDIDAKLRPLEEVKLTQGQWERRMWLTQRKFYGTSNVTISNPIHKNNLEITIRRFLQKYKNKKFDTLLALLVEFGKSLIVGRIKYEHDTKFADTGVSGDAGDVLIELTSKGDCEDFGHFYMRTIRMLSSIYKFILPPASDLYHKCQTLAENYIPYNLICRVFVNGVKDFHSTMLLVPRTSEYPVISYEVTDPVKSYILPNKTYDSWHAEHYFLLDHIGIHRLNRTNEMPKSTSINDLTVENLFIYNY